MFQPGISGNPSGRPKGSVSGRAQVLAALDRMLSKECNQQAIVDTLEKELLADPARFIRNTVVPLIPRSALDAPPPVPSVPSVPPPSVLRSSVLSPPVSLTAPSSLFTHPSSLSPVIC